MKTVKVVVYGKVQNVNLRAKIYQKAITLDIHGYVQNDASTLMTVTAILQGDEKKVQRLLEFIKSNPGRARVEDVRVTEINSPKFSEFSIIYE